MKLKLFDSVAVILGSVVSLSAAPAFAITHDDFGSYGQGGAVNGQTLEFGSDGAVYQVDSFLKEDGQGDAAQLGFGFTADYHIEFDSMLSDDGTDLTLTYEIRRDAPGHNCCVDFLHFVDAEMGDSWYDEEAYVNGTLPDRMDYEIDEPGFLFGDIYDNLFDGKLDGMNDLEGISEDVSMAFRFNLGRLEEGDTAFITIMLSEDGDAISPFSLEHVDPYSDAYLTYSGTAYKVLGKGGIEGTLPELQPAVPEPSAALVFALGALFTTGAVRRQR